MIYICVISGYFWELVPLSLVSPRGSKKRLVLVPPSGMDAVLQLEAIRGRHYFHADKADFNLVRTATCRQKVPETSVQMLQGCIESRHS